jgi:archaellum component FlaC
MKQREYINNQIDRLEAKMKHIDFYASRNDLDNIRIALAECLDQLGDIRASIEREPLSSDEINRR